MEFSAEELEAKWALLLQFVDTYIAPPRNEALTALYTKYQERIMTSPASPREYWHNALPGGYLDHVITVAQNAIDYLRFFQEREIAVEVTKEEVVFCALNHDLGKIGDETGEYYKPVTEAWKRNRGELYTTNEDIQYMDVSNRALFLLTSHGVNVSQREWLGILLADGLYEDRKNEKYLVTYYVGQQLKTELPHVIHFADMTAMLAERCVWRREEEAFRAAQLTGAINPQVAPKKAKTNPQIRNEQMKKTFGGSNAHAIFDELFSKQTDKKDE